uniref:FeoB-associated Cys-rich membrane protein n=1 Tax=Anaerococcus mediterraneensis TaxID=1870984 RepID=UPI0009F80C7B
MNKASWLLLAVIIAICTYIIYSKFVKKSEGSCGGCSACSGEDGHKSSCCH